MFPVIISCDHFTANSRSDWYHVNKYHFVMENEKHSIATCRSRISVARRVLSIQTGQVWLLWHIFFKPFDQVLKWDTVKHFTGGWRRPTATVSHSPTVKWIYVTGNLCWCAVTHWRPLWFILRFIAPQVENVERILQPLLDVFYTENIQV